MTYYVTALTNDNARLIVKEMQTTDAKLAVLVNDMWNSEGYAVATWQEA